MSVLKSKYCTWTHTCMHLSTYTKVAHNQINVQLLIEKTTFLWECLAQVSIVVCTKLSKMSSFTKFSFSLMWSGKLQGKDTTLNTAGRLSPPVRDGRAMPPQREGWLWKGFCRIAVERPLSASDYKFIFCKGTFWHNVHRKDTKGNLSANET